MKRFCLKIVLFTFPLVLIFGSNLYIAFHIGEITPFEKIVNFQHRTSIPILYEPAWHWQDMIQFKLTATYLNNPDILILGSSRMMQYSSDMAHNRPHELYNGSFYNATPEEQYNFMVALSQRNIRPSILILGLDLANFNNRNRLNNRAVRFPTRLDYRQRRLTGITHIMRGWFNDNLYYLETTRQDNLILLGITAINNQAGYTIDGSRINLNITQAKINQAINDDFWELENNEGYMFREGTSVNQEQLTYLGELLSLSHEEGIVVIGVLPPYHPMFANALFNSNNYTYLHEAIEQISRLFEDYGYNLYNYSVISLINVDESNFRDGIHADRQVALEIYTNIVSDHPDIFSPYSNVETLQSLQERMQNPLGLSNP